MHYRLEFLWRNTRIDASSKLYRFYILWALGQKLSAGISIASITNKGAIQRLYDNILDYCADDGKLKSEVERICSIVGDHVASLGAESREKLRDTIRSDLFFTNLKAKFNFEIEIG